MSKVFDCQKCGACCRAIWDVEVEQSDIDCGLPNDLVTDAGWGVFERMRQHKGVCIALRGTVGKQVNCSVYKVRPQVCRGFEPGSKDCLYAREAAYRDGIPIEPVDV